MYILVDTKENDGDYFFKIREFNDSFFHKCNILYTRFGTKFNSRNALILFEKLPKLILFHSTQKEVFESFVRGGREVHVLVDDTSIKRIADDYYYLTDMTFNIMGMPVVYLYKPEDFRYDKQVQGFFRKQILDNILKDL